MVFVRQRPYPCTHAHIHAIIFCEMVYSNTCRRLQINRQAGRQLSERGALVRTIEVGNVMYTYLLLNTKKVCQIVCRTILLISFRDLFTFILPTTLRYTTIPFRCFPMLCVCVCVRAPQYNRKST